METISYVYVRILMAPGPDYGKAYVGTSAHMDKRDKQFSDLNNPYAGPKINAVRAKYGMNEWVTFKYVVGYGDTKQLRPLRL